MVGWEQLLGQVLTTYIKIPQCKYIQKDIDNGSQVLIVFMVIIEKWLNMKKKAFCKANQCMNVLHYNPLAMVMTLEKIMTRRQGTIRCNILVI